MNAESQHRGRVPRRVLITGITGTLGRALASRYHSNGDEVLGVSHRPGATCEHADEMLYNEQKSADDARALIDLQPDILILNAGCTETRVDRAGLPQVTSTEQIFTLNSVFPSLVALASANATRQRSLDVVAIGSIADGSPSCFGPSYHASKAALHQFMTGVGPIVQHANPRVRIRLYRPGVIRGPLSRAPMLRLNERAHAIRASRCRNAPEADVVAHRIVRFIEGDQWVGSDAIPLSFRALALAYSLAPNTYAQLQRLGWRRGSRFADGTRSDPSIPVPQRTEEERIG